MVIVILNTKPKLRQHVAATNNDVSRQGGNMGYMRHHAIVVTSCNEELLTEAHKKASEIFSQVAPVTPETVNGYVSFLIAPDGSKEGWSHSEQGDKARDAFIKYLEAQRYDDGSISINYVEVQFGDDDGVTNIIRNS